MKISPFPNNKATAFSFTDDADESSYVSTKLVYEFLTSLNIKSTKTIWVTPSKRKSGNPEKFGKYCSADNLSNYQYLTLLKKIKEAGHEIGLHTVSGGNNLREETIEAYTTFKEVFNEFPQVNIMHGRNADNLYWGTEAFTHLIPKLITKLYTSYKSEGQIVGSPYFWGDISRKYSKYTRMFKTLNINTLKVNPSMPFKDPKKEFVNYWYSNTDLSREWLLRKILTESNIKKLIHQNGVCIGYSYLDRYVMNNKCINNTFQEKMSLLSRFKDSIYFATNSEILDRLNTIKHLSLKKGKSYWSLRNHSNAIIQDVSISGVWGEKVEINNVFHTIGESGTLQLEEIMPEPEWHPSKPELKKGEFFKLFSNQVILLLYRHFHGRKFNWRGW